MTTTQELIEASLRLIGAIDAKQPVAPKELQDAKQALNMMLSNWMLDRIMVWALTENTHTLVAGTSSYTIGTGGDISTEKPDRVLGAFVRDSDQDYPVEVVGMDEYNEIPDKTVTGRPFKLWYYPGPTIALGTVYMYFSPDAAYSLHLWTRKKLADITSLTADLTFPPGYEKAVKFNLALDLAPEYPGTKISPIVVKEAGASLDKIVQANSPDLVEPVNLNIFSTGAVYDGQSDTWRT